MRTCPEARELSPPGDVRGDATFSFDFSNVDLSFDSYRGNTVRLRYYLRVTITRGMGGMSEEFPIWVANVAKSVPQTNQIKARCWAGAVGLQRLHAAERIQASCHRLCTSSAFHDGCRVADCMQRSRKALCMHMQPNARMTVADVL